MTIQVSNHRVRIGIVGTGSMASQMAHAAKFVAGASVSCVLSRDSSRASEFCGRHAPDAVGSDDTSQLFDATDAVYVATPPQFHAAFVEQAILAGKPILCEKPLTISSSETSRLLMLARSARVPLVEAIWTLALPAYKEMKKAFDDRRNAVLCFDFSSPIDRSSQTHILEPDTGGVIVDRSVYGYAAGISLFGDVTRQTAWVTRDENGLEIDAELRLEHSEGARSLISLSIDKFGSNLLHVSNGSGLIALGPNSLASETLRRIVRPGITQSLASSGHGGLKSRLKALPVLRALNSIIPARRKFFNYGASQYAPILREFISIIKEGRIESDIVPHNMSEQVALLSESARSKYKRCE